MVSDDPREIEISLEGDGLLGDPGIACSRLADAIQRDTTNTSLPEKPRPAQPVATTPITPDFLFSTLAQVKSADAILVDESPSNVGILKQYLLTTLPKSFITCASGGLGFGLPAAAGIALAQVHSGENRRVIATMGEGSLQYSIQALYTMAQHHLPVTVIVVFRPSASRSSVTTLREAVTSMPLWRSWSPLRPASWTRRTPEAAS